MRSERTQATRSEEELAIDDRHVDGPHGPIPIRVYRRGGAQSDPGLVWLHGGGWAAGDLAMPEADWVARSIAARGVVVVSVDYRLAVDGVHFPVPLDDVVAAFTWTRANAESLGVEPSLLSLGGASAGGNLAAGAALRLRDEGSEQPWRIVLAYPMLHPHLPELSAELAPKVAALPVEDQVFDPVSVDRMTLNYAGSREALDDPHAFPANGDPTGLPPHVIVNSDADSLRASAEAYAALLATSGVSVYSAYEPGTKHGHINQPEERAAESTLEVFLRALTY
ncbi:hypothetical protein ASF88_09165 [Leifsonia sp. Leaf336]|uniref:alpha/beta hydrolase n=1 Tax=Leifsonia sp. Leaf336 TaxID=1736341 RepID=UPI0006FAEE47|nr:alpha/beta hydrolase [Leifsonia sp. Leaf336]KQR51776.1 hypothetical protein ASF88_09165 [Leifsonia sp. Leaf336]